MRTPWQLLNPLYLYTAAFEDGHINSQPKWLYGPCDRLIFSVAQVDLTFKYEKSEFLSLII